MNKVFLGVPCSEFIEPECFKSIFFLKRPENTIIGFNYIRGYDCAMARNLLVDFAINHGATHILMLDSDNTIPADGLEKLLSANRDIVFGWCPLKGDKTKSNFYEFRDGETDFPITSATPVDDLVGAGDNGIIKLRGAGMACALIKTSVFEKMPKNRRFQYILHEDGTSLSEDLFFCEIAKSMGFELWGHTGVRCGHIAKVVL
ncbi:MAG: hypothetical protein LBL75_03010 [Rickettsiales bacterium]|jgi:hypothetical protein|nr:hypothetical protein [Rickettsiales bacterium]